MQANSSKLALPVIHESLYVYACDSVNGGIALAEKWRLTLEQKNRSNSQSKNSSIKRRRSVLTGVDTTGLLPDMPFLPENLAENEEEKKDLRTSNDDLDDSIEEMSLPSCVIMDDNYFEDTAEDKAIVQL